MLSVSTIKTGLTLIEAAAASHMLVIERIFISDAVMHHTRDNPLRDDN